LPPSRSWTEPDRLAALDRYQVLDTPNETDFDDIVKVAAQICGVPMALISLVDSERQWFKARLGLGVSQTPREVAFCAHAIQQSGVFTVEDATRDARFDHNPLVTGDPNLRFYAGAPLETPDGFPLGTLCVLDTRPRKLTADQAFALKALARQVIIQLELRKALADAEESAQRRKVLAAELLHRVKNSLSLAQAVVDQTLRTTATNDEARTAIFARLVALGRASDMLTAADWSAMPLSDLIETTIAGSGVSRSRFHIEGPQVGLASKAALALALALHELTTNAVKYGALSTEQGQVAIAWTASAGKDGNQLRLEWRESGGPPVAPPTSRGFGSRLIQTALARDIGGDSILAFEPEGLRWTLEASLENPPQP
jgi:two-component sensor histidine kinase